MAVADTGDFFVINDYLNWGVSSTKRRDFRNDGQSYPSQREGNGKEMYI